MAGETYFTLDTFGTVAGASFAIVVVTNTLRTVFKLTTSSWCLLRFRSPLG